MGRRTLLFPEVWWRRLSRGHSGFSAQKRALEATDCDWRPGGCSCSQVNPFRELSCRALHAFSWALGFLVIRWSVCWGAHRVCRGSELALSLAAPRHGAPRDATGSRFSRTGDSGTVRAVGRRAAGSRRVRRRRCWVRGILRLQRMRGCVMTASQDLRSASQRRTANSTASNPLRIDRVATVMPVLLPGGRRVSVERWSGKGAPVVLLHGLLDCAAGWKHVAELMDCPCYPVDLPGFGGSDRPTLNRISASWRWSATGICPTPRRSLGCARTLIAGRRELGARTRRSRRQGARRARFTHRQLDYQGPVEALWGDRDRLVPPAHRGGVMTAFPQAKVSIWKKMGHHPQRERPNELARFIEAARGQAGAGAPGVASGSKPRSTGVLSVRFTPQPLAGGAGDLSAVT